MICQNCQQREANVQIIKTVNGETQKLFLCEQCAQQTQQANFMLHTGIIPDFLQALFGFTPTTPAQQLSNEDACPKCGITFSHITKAGKLGCSACYDHFAPQLEQLIRRIHGGGQHEGKIPQRKGAALRGKVEINKLKVRLQELIKKEEFEAAALMRDKIKELEQNLEGKGNET